MSVRDRVVSVLTATAIGATFAGSWIVFGFGAALLIVAAPIFVVAVLIAASAVDTKPALQAVPEPMRGEAPPVAQVEMRSPFPRAKR